MTGVQTCALPISVSVSTRAQTKPINTNQSVFETAVEGILEAKAAVEVEIEVEIKVSVLEVSVLEISIQVLHVPGQSCSARKAARRQEL